MAALNRVNKVLVVKIKYPLSSMQRSVFKSRRSGVSFATSEVA